MKFIFVLLVLLPIVFGSEYIKKYDSYEKDDSYEKYDRYSDEDGYDADEYEKKPLPYYGCNFGSKEFSRFLNCFCSICKLQADPGPCKGYFPRWYYDIASGTCKKFIYGGCQGNANNFVSYKDCVKACHKKYHH